MTITERATKVLTEIDAALEMAEKATPGPWENSPAIGNMIVSLDDRVAMETDPCIGTGDRPCDAIFIATSRTLLPKSLRCLKTAMQAIAWYNDIAEDKTERKIALRTLATLCDQWEASR